MPSDTGLETSRWSLDNNQSIGENVYSATCLKWMLEVAIRHIPVSDKLVYDGALKASVICLLLLSVQVRQTPDTVLAGRLSLYSLYLFRSPPLTGYWNRKGMIRQLSPAAATASTAPPSSAAEMQTASRHMLLAVISCSLYGRWQLVCKSSCILQWNRVCSLSQ